MNARRTYQGVQGFIGNGRRASPGTTVGVGRVWGHHLTGDEPPQQPGKATESTAELAPRAVPSPTVIGPKIFAPAPTMTPSPKVGWRLTFSSDIPPKVTPW